MPRVRGNRHEHSDVRRGLFGRGETVSKANAKTRSGLIAALELGLSELGDDILEGLVSANAFD